MLLANVTASRKAVLRASNLRGIGANGSNGALVRASKTKVRSQGENLLICNGDILSLADKNLFLIRGSRESLLSKKKKKNWSWLQPEP